MQFYERAFFVGVTTQSVFDTFRQFTEILEETAGLSSPDFRRDNASTIYQGIIGRHRAEQILDVKRKLGPKQTAILVNPIPYTAIRAVDEGQVLHTCLWSILSQSLSNLDVGQIVQEYYGKRVSAVVIEHLKINKTIPEIQHLHVFVDVDTCR